MSRLAFGLQPPDGAIVAWGARAIFRNGSINIPRDRWDCIGQLKERKSFLRDVGAHLPLICESAHEAWVNGDLQPDKGGKVTLIDDPVEDDRHVVVEADTRASYGYLYLVAYKINHGDV